MTKIIITIKTKNFDVKQIKVKIEKLQPLNWTGGNHYIINQMSRFLSLWCNLSKLRKVGLSFVFLFPNVNKKQVGEPTSRQLS